MPNYNKYHNGRIPFDGREYQFDRDYTNDQNDSEIGLIQLFKTIWNRKWLVIGSVLIFGFLAGIYAFLSTPIYESNGSLMIKQPQSQLSSLGLQNSGLSNILSNSYGLGVGSTLANELAILQSRKLSLNVADSLMQQRIMRNGRQFPVLFRGYPDDSIMTSRDTVALRLRSKLVFEKAENNADLIEVIYESPSPLAASQVINIAIAKYKDLSVSQTRSSAGSAVGFLEKERSRIMKNLAQAEEDLRIFMNNKKLVQVDAQTQELIEQMADLEARRQEARAKLVAVKSAVEQYKNKLNNIKPGLAEQYSEAIGPNISRLQYAKSELELEKQQLLTNNPNLDTSSSQITEINRKIDQYKERIKNLTKELIAEGDQYLGFIGEGGVAENISNLNQKLIELNVEQTQYQSQVDVISEQLEEQQQFFNNLPDNMIEFAKLKRDVKINEELYATVSKQLAETSLWEQTQFGLGRILDEGYIPEEPSEPNIPLFIFIGLIVGGFLSIGYLLVNQVFSYTIDGAEKLKRFDIPLLSVIPVIHGDDEESKVAGKEINGKNIPKTNILLVDNDSPFTESYRRLGNNIIYSKSGQKLRSILVTSSKNGEGKTTTVANLGVVLAETGYNTVIVDTDFRRPNLHNMFGLKQSPGIVDILSGEQSKKEAVRETGIPNLSVITAGKKPSNAAATTHSRILLNMLNELENEYDFVLIDTSPFGAISDASAILNQTDGIVVLAKFRETTEMQLSQTLQELYRLDANIIGTVLTAFDHTKSHDGYHNLHNYEGIYQD